MGMGMGMVYGYLVLPEVWLSRRDFTPISIELSASKILSAAPTRRSWIFYSATSLRQTAAYLKEIKTQICYDGFRPFKRRIITEISVNS